MGPKGAIVNFTPIQQEQGWSYSYFSRMPLYLGEDLCKACAEWVLQLREGGLPGEAAHGTETKFSTMDPDSPA